MILYDFDFILFLQWNWQLRKHDCLLKAFWKEWRVFVPARQIGIICACVCMVILARCGPIANWLDMHRLGWAECACDCVLIGHWIFCRMHCSGNSRLHVSTCSFPNLHGQLNATVCSFYMAIFGNDLRIMKCITMSPMGNRWMPQNIHRTAKCDWIREFRKSEL